MRILYHHRTLADGAEGIHIAEMVRAFRALGHDVRVVGGEPAAAGDHVEARRPTLAARIRRLLPDMCVEIAALAWNVPEYLAMRRALAEFAPAFVYQRHARFGLGAIRAAQRAHVPVALEVNCLFSAGAYHGFEPLTFHRMARAVERRALRAATCRFAVSSPLAAQVAEVSGMLAVVLPNGADPERFNPDRVSGEAVRNHHGLVSKLVVGWVGILRAWHGLELLLDAVAQVPEVHLLLVGDGPARDDIERLAVSLGMRERLTVTGRVAHADVATHIAAMDIAVVADERTGVASPMKLLEYMAMARAVVAPDCQNVRDVLHSGVEGVLFAQGDTAALAGVLRTFVGDPLLRARLGAQARQRVIAERNWDANARAALATLGLG